MSGHGIRFKKVEGQRFRPNPMPECSKHEYQGKVDYHCDIPWQKFAQGKGSTITTDIPRTNQTFKPSD